MGELGKIHGDRKGKKPKKVIWGFSRKLKSIIQARQKT